MASIRRRGSRLCARCTQTSRRALSSRSSSDYDRHETRVTRPHHTRKREDERRPRPARRRRRKKKKRSGGVVAAHQIVPLHLPLALGRLRRGGLRRGSGGRSATAAGVLARRGRVYEGVWGIGMGGREDLSWLVW